MSSSKSSSRSTLQRLRAKQIQYHRKYTLQGIAEKFGVSVGLVSLVLSGQRKDYYGIINYINSL